SNVLTGRYLGLSSYLGIESGCCERIADILEIV
ncbi:MAG: hypothetical protein ACI8O8_002485, partial [Oleiphilaceae bacterium]